MAIEVYVHIQGAWWNRQASYLIYLFISLSFCFVFDQLHFSVYSKRLFLSLGDKTKGEKLYLYIYTFVCICVMVERSVDLDHPRDRLEREGWSLVADLIYGLISDFDRTIQPKVVRCEINGVCLLIRGQYLNIEIDFCLIGVQKRHRRRCQWPLCYAP